MENTEENLKTIELTADVISAFVGNNALKASDLPDLIRQVHGAIASLLDEDGEEAQLEPAVPVRRSVTADHIICLEDGRKFKSLKRHLRSVYGLTPDDYRKKWGLKEDYPMVAPNYAKTRSEIAKKLGLGRRPIA